MSMGRPAHKADPATRRQVEAMAAYGIPEADIATVIAIDPKTLRRHYRSELDTGHIKANSRMAENLYKKAMGDGPQAVTATIFWLKTRARWKEATITEIAVTNDPLTSFLNEVAARGRRIHDRPPAVVDDAQGSGHSATLTLTASGCSRSPAPGPEGR